jgi:hypothetical protein
MHCEDSHRQIPLNQEQGESTMSELDTLTEQFERLLDGIRTKHTLEEWRFAYRKIIYSGGMKILDDFPEIIVGQAPLPPRSEKKAVAAPTRGNPAGIRGPVTGVTYGQAPPFHPSSIGELVCIVLGTCPQQQPQQT